jgi:hypothetical protein
MGPNYSLPLGLPELMFKKYMRSRYSNLNSNDVSEPASALGLVRLMLGYCPLPVHPGTARQAANVLIAWHCLLPERPPPHKGRSCVELATRSLSDRDQRWLLFAPKGSHMCL